MQVRNAVAYVMVVVGCLVISSTAMAQTTRELSIIVPLGEGGRLDRMARGVAEHLPGVSAFRPNVENILIKGGSDGYQEFLSRPPGEAVLAWFEPAASKYGEGYDIGDLAIINVQEIEPPILVVRSGLGIRSLADLVSEMRGSQGRPWRIGAGKAGGNLLLMHRQFAQLGIEVDEVDFKSGGAARKGILDGEIELTIGSAAALKKLGDAVIPLAVMSPRRIRMWPSAPSIKEAVAFSGAKPIYGASYRFFAVRSELKETDPALMSELVEALRRLTVESPVFRRKNPTARWFGPVESNDLIRRAHGHFQALTAGAQ